MPRVILLILMMFLQYALWGSWVPVAQTYFMGPKPVGIGLDSNQLGIIFAMMPVASLLMSPIFGNLADRFVNAEKLLGVLHLLSALCLFGLSKQTTMAGVMLFLGLHCLAFAPTVSLTSTVALANLPDPAAQFSKVRLAGSFGWFSSGVLLTLWRSSGAWNPLGDLFLMAAALGGVLGILCFFLPKTPPSKEPVEKFAFGKALTLMKDLNFMVFMLFGFVVSTQFDFYYLCTSGFLSAPPVDSINRALPEIYQGLAGSGLGIPVKYVSSVMSLAQLSEIMFMFALPWVLKTFGIRMTMFLGFVTMCLRFAIFAFIPVKAAVIPAMFLHGPAFSCLFVAGAIYVEQSAGSDIRASAQSLFNMATFGIGRVIGSLLAGYVQSQNTHVLPGRMNIPGGFEIQSIVHWQAIFVIPTGITLACALLFPFLFKPIKTSSEAESVS